MNPYQTRNTINYNIQEQLMRTGHGRRSLLCQAIQTFTSLPNSIKSSNSISTFNSQVKQLIINNFTNYIFFLFLNFQAYNNKI